MILLRVMRKLAQIFNLLNLFQRIYMEKDWRKEKTMKEL